MVICLPIRSLRRRGSLIPELLVAMLLLVGAMLPIAYSIGVERGLARLDYHRVVAMEIVDGEMETLAAGEWQSYPAGTHPYVVHANSAVNLPPGQFLLTVETNRLRLEWRPDGKHQGGSVVREAAIR
jgi:hypothetical protein